MINLINKIIVVTGGNGLIGTSILQYINDAGAIGLNLDLNVIDNIDLGTIKCDITSQISIEIAISKILIKYKRIDGWVNCAYPRTSDWENKFEDIKLDSWKKNVDMQLNSQFICCQLILKVMKDQENGSIVNISSIYGIVGPDFNIYNGTNMTVPAAYAAIKGGIINFTRYLASYYGKYSIRINCISPGGIFDEQQQQFVNNYVAKVPLKRMGLSKDIAPGVCFLLSDEASYITGHNLVIDGGWTAI